MLRYPRALASAYCGGQKINVGNRRLVEIDGATLSPDFLERARRWETTGHTVAFFGRVGEVGGLLVFGDVTKPVSVDDEFVD